MRMKDFAVAKAAQAALRRTRHRYAGRDVSVYDLIERGQWQAWLGSDPDYQQWLDRINRARNDAAGRRADAPNFTGNFPF